VRRTAGTSPKRGPGAEPLALSYLLFEAVVRSALLEDLGRAGDITTDACVPDGTQARGIIAARVAGTVAGVDLAAAAFRLIDPEIRVSPKLSDGAAVQAGGVVAEISGPARGILTAERVALNFLGHLSGIATATRGIADAIAHTSARVVCTRKTTPGLRAVEKYAVRCGGGLNHRFGLDDAMLIKDNHIALAGGIGPALQRARAHAGHLVKIEIEVDTLAQLEAVFMNGGADAVLLDNMSADELRQAVGLVAGRAVTEASGGITPANAAAIAETGVDLISAGWLTHSVRTLDIGLDMEAGGF
jgi:nicotinate-nucleotide pyrophosphorylase (carboxylating)